MADRKEIAGRVAIVTGAGRNIGRAIALALADGGAAVVVNSRNNRFEAEAVAREIDSKGGRATVAIGNVSDAAAVDQIVATAIAQFGRIDFLINNAAPRPETPLEKLTLNEWREVTSVILDGAFLCVKSCLAGLKKSGAGAIVNIGGLSAHTGAKNRVHVVTAKAGLSGFTRALAHDLADHEITVNCVSPGFVTTTRTTDSKAHVTRSTLSGKRGTPDDVAALVRFLCGPDARHITGQTIHANGGAYLG